MAIESEESAQEFKENNKKYIILFHLSSWNI